MKNENDSTFHCQSVKPKRKPRGEIIEIKERKKVQNKKLKDNKKETFNNILTIPSFNVNEEKKKRKKS